MNAIAPMVRIRMSAGVSAVPESEVAACATMIVGVVPPPELVTTTGCDPNSSRPVMYAVTATATTATSV